MFVRSRPGRQLAALALFFTLLPTGSEAMAARGGKLRLTVIDKETRRLLPCRMHLKNERGKPRRVPKVPYWRDHFVFPGEIELKLPRGQYHFEIERGPEYINVKGYFIIDDNADDTKTIELSRVVDMAAEGWWAADLHVHRPVRDIGLLMQAENLHVVPVITWWNKRNLWAKKSPPEEVLVQFDGQRYYHKMACEDEREGGALLFFNLRRPLDISATSREYPSPMKFLLEARKQPDVWIDIEKPFWWDVPVWLASGKVDSIGLANNHMCRALMYEDEAWGKPRDAGQLPSPRGNGYWTQEIYYHILNTGLRLPPSAGSASGVLPNPVGYNRVYVHVDGELTWDKWWNGLRAGRSFVTNGPLLECRANGELPGTIFQGTTIQETTVKPFRVSLEMTLTTTDHVPNIEVVQNGKVVQSLPCQEKQTQKVSAEITFRESGWFLVRAITDNPRTFRFASTAPFYVELGEHPRRISRESAQFFLDWVNERIDRVPNKLTDAAQLQEVLRHHEAAREFWQGKVDRANAP